MGRDSLRFKILLLLAVVFTLKEVNDKVCDALCKRNYDGGYSIKAQCVCVVNMGELKQFMSGRIIFPAEVYHEPEPVVPHKPVSEWQ